MSTISFSTKYRPIRIGFLIRDENIDDIVKASGINTLLWGGIYNPIIPVSKGKIEFASQLLNLFSVDVLYAVSHNNEIDLILKNNEFLKDPSHYTREIFYEDWNTKKNILGYLDSTNIVDYYWEKEFKNKPKRYKSNFSLVKWEHNDNCCNLFSILFGYFPNIYDLKDDFKDSYLKGLKAKEISIKPSELINYNLSNYLTPIETTSLELLGYGGTWRGDGLYIGFANNFRDLLNFWNLRASGLILNFISKDYFERFNNYGKEFIKRLDSIPNKNPNIEDWINIYFYGDDKDFDTILKTLQGNKQFVFSHCSETIWNGLNIKPSTFNFAWQQVLGNVEKTSNNYSVSIPLPEKKFISSNRPNKNVDSQHLVVSVDAMGEYSYPEHTLKPPFIRELNEFYSREIHFDPWKIRIEREGIGIIIKIYDSSVLIHPIPHQRLIEKIFELAGYKTKISQSGLLAKQIIQSMREEYPLEACRVFKIKGVRKLIASPKTKSGKYIKWSEATKLIWENDFDKFQNLYIEPRDSKNLNANDVFNFLIRKKIFSPKLYPVFRILRYKWTIKCRNCGLKERILLSHYEGQWKCPFCHFIHFLPNYIKEDFSGKLDKYWRFIRSGLFAKENNQEGAIPVIVSLLTIARILDSSEMMYSTSLNLKNSIKCEIDFCIIKYSFSKIEMGISETKSGGQKIDLKDINNLKSVQDKIKTLGIECYIIFSKVTDQYELEEIELFRNLMREHRKFVILSNKELEPYHPYWEISETDKLPEKYALDLEAMSRNSIFLYPDMKT